MINFKVVFILLSFLLLVGCAADSKVYNLSLHPIEKNQSMDDIAALIIAAGKRYHWVMTEKEKGVIIGRLKLRKHRAVIKIEYTPNSYNLTYVDSKNLDYNKSSNTIHRNYNNWIRNLEVTLDNYLKPLVMNEELIAIDKKTTTARLSQPDSYAFERSAQSEAIYDVIDKPIKQNLSLAAIEKSIIDAGQLLGWKMQPQSSGFILGRQLKKKYTAIIKMNYSPSSYSIRYLTSRGLYYNEDEYGIHRFYNSRLKVLERNIDKNLAKL